MPTIAEIRLALDKSARKYDDVNGHLHVTLANVSKANVCPYYGREIPASGLDPDKIYNLYRDPKELAAAAHTINGKQLMGVHVLVSSDDPKMEKTVGAVGTDAVFNDPYLQVSLTIWDAEAIAEIESGAKKEISCGYRFTADMTPGSSEAGQYDGVMRDLCFNHVALVPEGRAGPDVVVADGKLGEAEMKFSVIKTKLAEKIATDSALTEDDRKRLTLALDAMEEEAAEDEGETDEEKAEREKAEAADKRAKDKKAAKDKAAKDKAAKDKEACDEDPSEKAEALDEEEDDKDDKKAMDAAITKARADTIAEMNAIFAAKSKVAPIVGDITVAMDSAASVYKFALDTAGVPTKGVHPSAFETLVDMHLKASAAPVRIATDSKTRGDVVSFFPQLARYA